MKWLDENWLDIMAAITFISVMLFVTFWNADAHAGSFVGQSEPDEDGRVVCYYEDFNTGETYMKHSLYVCSSS